jgi:hypothetical protein
LSCRVRSLGSKPGIVLGEDVAQDLLFGLACVGIALEAAAAFVGRTYAPDGFADHIAIICYAKAVLAVRGNAALGIDLHDTGGKTRGTLKKPLCDAFGRSPIGRRSHG